MLWNRGRKEFEKQSFRTAWSAFNQVLKVCSNNRQVVVYYLESVLRSNDRSLLKSGMKLLIEVMNNAAKFISSCGKREKQKIVGMFELLCVDGAESNSEFQAKQQFQPDDVLQITMDLYDVSLESIENWKNRINDDLVSVEEGSMK